MMKGKRRFAEKGEPCCSFTQEGFSRKKKIHPKRGGGGGRNEILRLTRGGKKRWDGVLPSDEQ